MNVPSRNTSFVANMLRQTVGDIRGLISAEIRLATTEVKENAMTMGKGGGMVAAGGLLGLYALGLLLLGIVDLLEAILPKWLASVIVGMVVGALGGGLAIAGRQRIKDAHLVPQQPASSLAEAVEVVDSGVQ